MILRLIGYIYEAICFIFDGLNDKTGMIFAYLFFVFVMLMLPVWGTLTSHLAGKKGRSPALWLLIGMFASFLGPIIVILFVKKRKDYIKPSRSLYNWTCVECWHSNDEEALTCAICGAKKPKETVE